MLPPGRERLATNPSSTGYAQAAITIGIERVAPRADRAIGFDVVASTPTGQSRQLSKMARRRSTSTVPQKTS
jgi:hypothetical protein